MGESIKSVCALILIVAAVAASVAWVIDPPNTSTWIFRIASPLAAILALGVILGLHLRPDAAPDYLRAVAGRYFNRDGFCFAIVASAEDGVAYMNAYFQSQRDRPCMGRIAVRPSRGFFMTRAKIEAILYEVDCPPAGFGMARIAIPIPVKLQGKRYSFDVGASVEYPDGKGQRLRFHDGVFLHSSHRLTTNLGDTVRAAVMLIGAATGTVVISKPATATVVLPKGVAEELFSDAKAEIIMLWRLGDPPLKLQ